MKKIFYFIFLMMSYQSLRAATTAHDFVNTSWSNGKSCLICHDLKNYVPKFSPPGSRVVNIQNLSTQEQAAFDRNSNNVSCLVCHQSEHSSVAINTNSSSGGLPPVNTPGTSSGSEGSTGIRVINQARNLSDCLQCHDVHNNDSLKLLKSDYYQN
jgi:hypothetical protein